MNPLAGASTYKCVIEVLNSTLGFVEEDPCYGFTVNYECGYSGVKFTFCRDVEAFYECFRECYLVANVFFTALHILPYEEFYFKGLTHRGLPHKNSILRFINTNAVEFKIENFINFYTEIYTVVV